MDFIQQDFEAFHEQNPEVYRLFDKYTREMMARGYKHGSAGLIFERIRWELNVELIGNHEPILLNNNHRSRYARLWEQRNPAHRGFFRKRVLTHGARPYTHVDTRPGGIVEFPPFHLKGNYDQSEAV